LTSRTTAEKNVLDLLNLLVERGSKPLNTQDYFSNTLSIAIETKNPKIVKIIATTAIRGNSEIQQEIIINGGEPSNQMLYTSDRFTFSTFYNNFSNKDHQSTGVISPSETIKIINLLMCSGARPMYDI